MNNESKWLAFPENRPEPGKWYFVWCEEETEADLTSAYWTGEEWWLDTYLPIINPVEHFMEIPKR